MFFAQFRPRSALKKMCRMHFCKFLTPPPSIHLQNVIFILLNPFLIPAIDLIISSEVSQIILFGGPIWGPYDNVNFNVFEKTSEKYDICTHLTCTRLISQWGPQIGPPNDMLCETSLKMIRPIAGIQNERKRTKIAFYRWIEAGDVKNFLKFTRQLFFLRIVN